MQKSALWHLYIKNLYYDATDMNTNGEPINFNELFNCIGRKYS